MRGLIADEAETLRDQLDPFDPFDRVVVDENESRLALLERLVARGLLVVRESDWYVDVDDPSQEVTYSYWEVTQRGRIALACHAAMTIGSVAA